MNTEQLTELVSVTHYKYSDVKLKKKKTFLVGGCGKIGGKQPNMYTRIPLRL
jgi:hypothetical protein